MRRLLLVALPVAVTVLAGCGEREEIVEPAARVELELLLSPSPAVNHAPIFAARANGHLERLALELELREPDARTDAAREVADGRAALAAVSESELLRARQAGLAVVSVAALVQEPLAALITLPDPKGGSPAPLDGDRIGVATSGYGPALVAAIFDTIAADAERIDQVQVDSDPAAALAAGEVDGLLAGFNHAGERLRLDGREPELVRVDGEGGVPRFDELVLIASEQTVAEDPGLVRSVVAALAAGTDDLERVASEQQADAAGGNGEDVGGGGARTDPIVDAIARVSGDDPELVRATIAATLPLFEPPGDDPYGWQDPDERARFAAFAERAGVIDEPLAVEDSYTNELLPGEGL